MNFSDFLNDMVSREGFHLHITDFGKRLEFQIWSPRKWDTGKWTLKYRHQIMGEHSKTRYFDTWDDMLYFMNDPKDEETLAQTVKRLSSILEKAVEKYPELKELVDDKKMA